MQNDTSSFGALVGRVVNRISGARFTLNGTIYKLIPNDGENTIHGILTRFSFTFAFSSNFTSIIPNFPSSYVKGGPKGFSHVVWKVSNYKKDGPHPHITLTYHSTDGEQGE